MESIGVKIQVDGGKQFRAELEQIKQTSKAMSAELKNVVNGLDSTGDAAIDARKQISLLGGLMDEAGKKVSRLSEQLKQQETNLKGMKDALAAAVAQYGAGSPEVQKLTNAITRQETEIAKTKTQLAQAKGEYASYGQQLDAAEKELKDVEGASKKAGKATEDAGKQAEKAAGGWTIIKGAIKDFVVSAVKSAVNGLKSLVKEAVKASDAMDKFGQTLSFGGFSADEINNVSAAIKSYADKTVYDLETIANTTATLGANGVKDFEKLTEAMGNLNAVAGGDANTFQSVALALTQTAGAGKLTTENWRQMMNQIPGAAGVLKQALLDAGAYTGNFEEALKKGKITAEEFNAAIMKVGNEPIAVEAAASAKTFEGAIGNLKATVVSALQSIIGMIGMENITGFINSVTDFISDKMMPAIQEMGNWINDNLMPIIRTASAWIQANVVPVVRNIYSWFVEKILPIIIRLGAILQETLMPVIISVFNWIKEHVVPIISSIISFLGTVLPPIINALVSVLKPVINFLKAALEPAIKVISVALGGIIDAGKKVVDFFKNMKIEIPKIKLPHFKISGKFSLNPLQVPHLDIDWYDKGGIFRSPSIIGVGEKRPEFVGALDDLRQIFREEAGVNAGVNINVYASDNMNVNELAEIISDKIQANITRRTAVYA